MKRDHVETSLAMLLHTFAITNLEKSCNSFGTETFEIEHSQKYSLIVCNNKYELFKTEQNIVLCGMLNRCQE